MVKLRVPSFSPPLGDVGLPWVHRVVPGCEIVKMKGYPIVFESGVSWVLIFKWCVPGVKRGDMGGIVCPRFKQ